MNTMSESKKLNHKPETIAVMKELRKVDQFMFGGENIKSALDQAFETGAIGFFALDCVVSEPVATEEGIGKIPLVDPVEIKKFSGLLYQKESIIHITNELIWAGLQVSWWAFIGNDDFAHCVSPKFSIDNTGVATAVTSQIGAVKQEVEAMSERFAQTIMSQFSQQKLGTIKKVGGWLEEENSNEQIQHDHSMIAEALLEGLKKSRCQNQLQSDSVK